MKEKNRTLVKNMGLFTIGSFGSKILSFLLVPLYTAVLSTAEYGSIDLMTTTSSLLTPILLLSIFDATLRFGMDPNYESKDVLSTSVNIAIKGSVLMIIGVVIAYIFNIISIERKYLIFLCIYFILGAFSNIFNLYLRGKNKAAVIAVSGIICTFVMCISNIILLLVFKMGIMGYMVSNTISILIQNVYQVYFGKIYKDMKLFHYKDLSKPMIKYSFPLIANSVSWWINNASDRYILTFFRGIAENGIYSVSYKIPTILTMFQGIFFNAWSISAISEFDENDTDGFIGKNYSLYTFISLLICSGLLIINKPLASFLYKSNYFDAWKCVPFLLMGTVFSGISQFEGSLFAAMRDTKSVAKTTIIGAIVNTICNIVFIYFIGSIGAAFATLLGYTITWWLRTRYLQKNINMEVNWLIHYISILLVVIQSIFAAMGCLIIIQIFLLVIVVLLNKQYFIKVINIISR